MELTAVGKRISKKDAPSKVAGSAAFIQDVSLPGMLYGKILYSRYPHARIKNIDITKAQSLPGVKAVLTGATGERGRPKGASIQTDSSRNSSREGLRYINGNDKIHA
ncbi:MAG: hypothetical protein ABSH06_02300 [Thermodesulfobacteriota bacterium]|jgi:CO/xanthine dehydrogenase Mo-binding subunit